MTKPTNPIPIVISVESGPCAGGEAEVRTRQIIIGRDADNGLALVDDATVSRRHASLTWESGGWVLRDLGSKNGTALVNATGTTPVTGPQPLEPGQEILVGSARLSIRRLEPKVLSPPEQLRILLRDNTLHFELSSGAAVLESFEKPFAEPAIEQAKQALHDEVGRRAVMGGVDSVRRFADACERMTGLLLPDALRSRLKSKPDIPLTLLLDPALLDLPWEALLPSEGYLCMARPVSRQVLLAQPVRGAASKGNRCLIVANPTGDLHRAHEEAEQLLHRLTHEFGMGAVTYIAGGRATTARVADELERHDIAVYMGHATHDPERPGQSGWRLADGVLSFDCLQSLRSVPSVVIASACDSAREVAAPQSMAFAENTSGPAAALLLAGVEQFIGTLWPIPVVSGTAMGAVTLGGILSGRSMADSLRQARLDARDRLGASALEYCGFIQYGLPGWKLNP